MSKRPTHPRPSPSPEPNRGRGRPVRRDASTLHEQVREKIKAYPGTTTYIDLIRKNKRDSFLLMLGMIALGVGLGAIIGAVIGGYSGAGANDDPGTLAFYIPSIILGAGVALVVGVLGSVWSYFQGANAILRMVHAKEITPELDAELFNVVDEMRLAAGIPMPKVYLIPESALNAFATGRDPEHGVVAITTGLRAKLNRDELQGVIAHEIAHIRHYDIRFSLLMATMVGLIVMACDIFLRIAFHGGMRSRRSSDKGGGAAVLIMILLAVVLSIVAPIENSWGGSRGGRQGWDRDARHPDWQRNGPGGRQDRAEHPAGFEAAADTRSHRWHHRRSLRADASVLLLLLLLPALPQE